MVEPSGATLREQASGSALAPRGAAAALTGVGEIKPTDEAAKRDTRDNASGLLGVLDLDVPDCGVHAVGTAALRQDEGGHPVVPLAVERLDGAGLFVVVEG